MEFLIKMLCWRLFLAEIDSSFLRSGRNFYVTDTSSLGLLSTYCIGNVYQNQENVILINSMVCFFSKSFGNRTF